MNNQYNPPFMDNNYSIYNNYDLLRLEEQINDLRLMNQELTKRLLKIENYLGISNLSNQTTNN
jgi:hypothetical protein